MTTAQSCVENFEGSSVAPGSGFAYLPTSPLLTSLGTTAQLPVPWNGWIFDAGGVAAVGSPWDASPPRSSAVGGGASYAFLQVNPGGVIPLTPATLSKTVAYLGDTGVVSVSFAYAARAGHRPVAGSTLVCTLAGVIVSTIISFPVSGWSTVGPVTVVLPAGIVAQDQALLQFSLSQAVGDAAVAIDLVTVTAACPARSYAPPGTNACLPCPASAPGATSCVPPTCSDGLLDGGEADVDCGGTVPSGWPSGCARCGLGRTCRMSADCAAPAICSTYVANGTAAASPPSPSPSASPAGGAEPAPLVGRCVDPQLAAAAWAQQQQPAGVVAFGFAALALVAPPALTLEGVSVLQAALPCTAAAAVAGNGSVFPAGSIVSGGSFTAGPASAYSPTLQRAALSITLITAPANASAGPPPPPLAPPDWQSTCAAQVAGGSLSSPRRRRRWRR